MDVEPDHAASEGLESREPSLEDAVDLCRHLNAEGARYVVIGGFAIRAAGYIRQTMDLDLLIDASIENEARVFKALTSLPDQAVRELSPGDVSQFTVVRVADEIVVDLMQKASGITYDEAAQHVVVHQIDDVRIPFASPQLLWRMKKSTYRTKDMADLHFLRLLSDKEGFSLPDDAA